MPLSRVKTYWRLGPVACALFTGEGRFELRLLFEGDVLRRESCNDSGDAYEKSKAWHRNALRRIIDPVSR